MGRSGLPGATCQTHPICCQALWDCSAWLLVLHPDVESTPLRQRIALSFLCQSDVHAGIDDGLMAGTCKSDGGSSNIGASMNELIS